MNHINDFFHNIYQNSFVFVYRELVEPIGDGPQYNPNGTADVKANLHDSELSYSITAQDFVRENKNRKPIKIQEDEYDEEEI